MGGSFNGLGGFEFNRPFSDRFLLYTRVEPRARANIRKVRRGRREGPSTCNAHVRDRFVSKARRVLKKSRNP